MKNQLGYREIAMAVALAGAIGHLPPHYEIASSLNCYGQNADPSLAMDEFLHKCRVPCSPLRLAIEDDKMIVDRDYVSGYANGLCQIILKLSSGKSNGTASERKMRVSYEL